MTGLTKKSIDWSRKDQAVFEFYVDDCWHAYLAMRKDKWLPIIHGDSIVIEGTGFCFNDFWYEDLWTFSDGLDGELVVRYFLPCEGPEKSTVIYQGTPRAVLKRSLPIM